MTTKPWSSTAPRGEFRPFVEAEESVVEFSLRAVILGALFGILFGAVSVYVGLRAGLTVSASIPIAVLSISILRAFGRSTILENNIVQTTGSAGESAAAGVIFTMPALIFLGFSLNAEYWRIFFLALMGGWLGVLFMIPLRRQLIVKEHGNLTFPEGTACADVLVAGERGGSFAGRVFWGLGLGGVYTFAMNTLGLWTGQPDYQPAWLPGASIRAAVTSEYLGVGYIIGPRVAGLLFAGGVISWLVLMPAIKFFGSLSPNAALYPSTIPIPQMTPDQLWSSYIRPMGAGAVAASGLITLIKTMPTIFSALKAGLKDIREKQSALDEAGRTERDISMKFVLIGSAVIVAMMWAFLKFKPIPGAQTGAISNLIAAIFVVVFGFLFVTVASRISGLIGNSSNPVSGMTIATLMATCAMFLVMHWTANAYAVLALTIGGVVCIASAIAGATSQDLKTGYLVGATPKSQQIGLLIGVAVSSLAVGGTLILMNVGLAQYKPMQIALDINHLPSGVEEQQSNYSYEGKTYVLVNALGSHEIPDGKYLYDPQTQRIEVQWVQGIGSEQAAAPQARLMATVISGILNQRLPWRLVFLGVFLVLAIELLGIRSLPFAVGSYLSIATTLAMFAGGMVRWLAEQGTEKKSDAESEVSPGSLYASGLIAAGGVFGLLAIVFNLLQDSELSKHMPHWLVTILRLPWPEKLFSGWGERHMQHLRQAPWLGVFLFVLLAISLFISARKKLKQS
ncbi:MAG TPA: oligopeptide transporter, OPT family [Candidatus Limnocylindrales bacterium]|nr:oligopeptide transporter, OPT family [Candidatus Limnocylindrales bacterium]